MLNTPLDSDSNTQWMGFRPSTADSLPIIDRRNSVFLNFGHQHLGLTQAVVSAQMVAALYFGDTAMVDPTAYRLNRFKLKSFK